MYFVHNVRNRGHNVSNSVHMVNEMEDKNRVMLMVIIAGLVLATNMGLILTHINKRSSMSHFAVPGIIGIILILFAATYIRSRYDNFKNNIPIEDEYSQKITTKAAIRFILHSI